MNRLLPFAILILISLPAAAAQDFTARVVGVSDGDTLTVLTASKEQVKIRLHGVDAPESKQDFGSRAKQATSDLAFGKDVTVRAKEKDRYGRTVAEIILPGGKSLNRELVGQGMAWWYKQYAPNDRELATLEAEARKAKRGLWGQPGAVAPWEWRKDGGLAVPVGAGAIGNKKSRAYHTPQCRSLGKMNPENRVNFASAAEAERAGFKKAGDCR